MVKLRMLLAVGVAASILGAGAIAIAHSARHRQTATDLSIAQFSRDKSISNWGRRSARLLLPW